VEAGGQKTEAGGIACRRRSGLRLAEGEGLREKKSRIREGVEPELATEGSDTLRFPNKTCGRLHVWTSRRIQWTSAKRDRAAPTDIDAEIQKGPTTARGVAPQRAHAVSPYAEPFCARR